MNAILAEAIFEPNEIVILMEAHARALVELEVEYVLDDKAKSKLERIVLAIGHTRVMSGGGLASDKDAEGIASIAANRFQRLCAG
jgi:hypothetical protein